MTKPNFSKLALALVMAAYFAAVVVGSIVVLKAPEQAQYFFLFVAAPTATALGFYSWKAKHENVVKINKNTKNEGES
jgi:hypothetical protein